MKQLVYLFVLCSATATAAEPGVQLIDRSLRMQPVRVLAIDRETLTVRDDQHDVFDVKRSETVGLIRIQDDEMNPSPTAVAHLADGQRLPGRLGDEPTETDNALSWSHPTLGSLDIPLDQLASVRLDQNVPLAEPSTADVIGLRNGDRLEGFITSLDDPVQIEITTDGEVQTVETPLARVASIVLVTPSRKPQGVGIWLDDGTIIHVSQLEMDGAGNAKLIGPAIASAEHTLTVPFAEVNGVALDSTSVLPLAGLSLSEITGPLTRYQTPRPSTPAAPAALNLLPLRFSGPIQVRYVLPATNMRFAATASLPADALPWADCTLIIRSNGEVVHEATLNSENPETSFNVVLEGSELTIELTENAHGPVMDTVVFHRAMVRDTE